MRRWTRIALMMLAGTWCVAAPGEALASSSVSRADSLCAVADSLLSAGDLRAAEREFRRALQAHKNYPVALNGLGRVFMVTPNALLWAIKYFKMASVADPEYWEARQNMAETYQLIGDTKELRTYQKLTEANPDHDDAWYQIGRIHRVGIDRRYRDDVKAEEAFRTQVGVNPNHMGARLQLGALLAKSGRTGEALDYLQVVAEEPNPLQRKAIISMARVHQLRREFDRAGLLMDAYVQDLDERERRLYYDLSLVATGEELERFRAAPESEWERLSDRFWASRDPAPVTAANERLIEHRRRVAYAREHYGDQAYPWDARGEVYVRYGEPDHVSASGDIRFETDPDVIAVKDRLVMMAGRAIGPLVQARSLELGDELLDAAGAVSTARRQIAETGHFGTADGVVSARSAQASGSQGTKLTSRHAGEYGAESILGWPVYPVVDVVWEYWIYAHVGRGFEVTFTQPHPPGPFDYAEPPFGSGSADRSVELAWQRLNPRVVADGIIAGHPDYYLPDFATGPLDFYFDSARFRSPEGGSLLEVYFGIPVGSLKFEPEETSGHVAVVRRGVAVYSEAGDRVHRTSDEMELFSDEVPDTSRLAFVPVMDRVSLEPGEYRVSLQVLDAASGRSQVYNQRVVLPDPAPGALSISDIEMASLIRPADSGRFLKGDIAVVPNPTRTYVKDQPVFLYYEIYNLARDTFGATRYKVSYEIRSAERSRLGVRVLRTLGRLLGQRDGERVVRIEYEHTGEQSDDRGYLQLDMSHSEPGDQTITVKVVDTVTGQSTQASELFGIR